MHNGINTPNESIDMPKTPTLAPLHKRPDFLLSIFIPIALAIIVGLVIIAAEGPRPLCFQAECFDTLVQMLKVPIAILALAFPLAGMVAAYHRSIETNEQIRIAQSNNTFANFIKHRDDFTDYIGEYLKTDVCKCTIIDPRRLYRHIYPSNNYNELNTDAPDIEKNPLITKINKVHEKLERMSESNTYSDEGIFELFQLIQSANRKLKLTPKPENRISIRYNGKSIHGIVFSLDKPMKNISELSTILNRIKSFNHLTVPLIPDWLNDRRLSKAISDFLTKNKLPPPH